MFKIQKRDGTLEDFDRRKIITAAVKSGATNEEAEKLAREMEAWLSGRAVNGTVKSSDLRLKALSLLNSINQSVKTSFEYYRKPVI